MNCDQVAAHDLAEQYVRGQLDAAAQDEFEVHLLECAQCLREVEALQALQQELSARAPEIRARSERIPRWRWMWVPALAVLLVGGAALLIRIGRRHQEVATQPPAAVTAPAAEAAETPRSANVEASQSQLPVKTAKPPQTAADKAAPPAPQLAQSPAVLPAEPTTTASAVPGKTITPELPAMAQNPPATKLPAISDDAARERFQIGFVEPPPYTFAGFTGKKPAKNAKQPVTQGLSESTKQGTVTDPMRIAFQNGMLAYSEGRYSDAISDLQAAAQQEPDAPDVHFYLGIARLARGRAAEAVPALQKVVTLQRSRLVEPAHLYLAKAYVQLGKWNDAESEFEAAAAQRGPLSAEARSLLARLRALRSKLPN